MKLGRIKARAQKNAAQETLDIAKRKALARKLCRLAIFLGYVTLLVRGDDINAIGLSLFYFGGVFKETLG